ncbi:MAG: glycoside hydrolase [Treponema sp.]|jgi:spore germination protein YaaH|nr:glycoside hydrolase [Treponema sp.]
MKHSILSKCIKTAALALFLASFSQCSSNRSLLTGIEPVELEEEAETEAEPEIEIDELPPVIITSASTATLPVTTFNEIWAYVVAGSEAALRRGLPLTDIVYFGAEIDAYGKLADVPRRQNLSFSGRVHLVVGSSGRALTHFALMPGSSERRTLIADLLAAARNYDGLQIDFENVPARDGEVFLSFLRELRAGLGDKMFTIALPARTRKIADDVYDYDKIKPIVDRIFVMAYDEHWSGSSPGSVASLQWCRNVANYSLSAIGRDKLVMGLPFYGRAWGDYSPSRALIYNTIAGIIRDENVREIRYENGIPFFNYNKNVSIKVYFEDEKSLSARMEMYKSLNVRAIGFWRLGQETQEVWKILQLAP